jgi:hypothetical protein
MALQYLSNLKIGGLTLTLNPSQYEHKFRKYGTYERSISGGLVDFDINGEKLIIEIKGLAQTQIEEIKKRVALKKIIEFIDYVPIAEKNSRSRTVYEDLGSETIESEIICSYIPVYSILITNFEQTYGENLVTYTLFAEET